MQVPAHLLFLSKNIIRFSVFPLWENSGFPSFLFLVLNFLVISLLPEQNKFC